MFSERNQQIRDYIDQVFVQEDEILHFVRSHAKELKLPDIQIPANVGKFLYLLAKIHKSQRILEIGTLGGYSTIWLARSLNPRGMLISLEIDPRHVKIAGEHIQQAGLNHCVEIRQGKAIELLEAMVLQEKEPFDLVFIDADKMHNKSYLDYALQLTKSGSLILVDNLMPKGNLIGTPCNDEAVFVYQFNEYLAHHPRLETTLITTVAQQGRLDCLSIARVKNDT